jgi:hypothetical protein
MYKSKLEQTTAHLLKSNGYPVNYEPDKISYLLSNNYIPDWKITDNVYVETKGRWVATDRRKIKEVILQNPNITIIMCFQDPNMKITKNSKTTYAKWCDKNNIRHCTLNSLISTLKSL